MNNSNISILLGQRYDDHPDQAEEPTNFQDKSFQVFQDYADWLEPVDMPEPLMSPLAVILVEDN